VTVGSSRLLHPLLAWPWPLHLAAAPIPPLLAFVHTNRAMVDWTQATLAYGATVAVELLLVAALAPILRSVRTAAIVVSLAALLFYSQGVMGGLELPAWAAVLALAVFFALRPRSGEVATTFANLLAGIGLVMPLVTLYGDETVAHVPAPAPDRFERLGVDASPRPDLPDVVYLVLDGYGSAGVISDRFGYDSPLPAALRARGFSVADEARSNYVQTALSFGATLNLDFVQELLSEPAAKSTDRAALRELCRDNLAVRTFRAAGYRIVELPGEYSFTRQLADERRRPWLWFTEFEYMLVNRTPVQGLTSLTGLPQSWLPHQVRRHHLRWVLDALAEGDDDPGPTFTFAHVVAPHPPFVMAADGSYRPERARAAFADGNGWRALAQPFGEVYADGYVDQVRWLDAELPRVVDGILARSPDALIVIHGDHGPGSALDWRGADQTDLEERASILMAARLPGGRALSPTFTPVNTFRVVFELLFDADLPLLPDRTWFTTWTAPYTFVEVTDEVRAR
jgi:hypothetical protein